MALTYGFYNSYKGDRKYDAEQVSAIFDGILKDGIIPSYGQLFDVNTASNGMQITVGTGRAWFNHTWTLNDSVMLLTVPQSDITRDRYDTVVLEVNHEESVRANAIKIVQGTPAVNPAKPTLVNTDKIRQYPLAYILVKAGSETVPAERIENAVGLSPTVFATGILETVAIDDLWSQWEGEWHTWFEGIKLQLSGDIVTNLQYQIEQNRESIEDIYTKFSLAESIRILYNLPEGSSVDDLYANIYSRLRMIMLNKALVTVRVTTSSGNAMSDIPIDGIATESGGIVKTNSNGVAEGFANAGSVTLSISGYADIADYSKSVTLVKGETYSYSFVVSTRKYLSVDATRNLKFSANIKTLNASVTGSGAPGISSINTYSPGAGGNGGQSILLSNVSVNRDVQYSVQVGGGGGSSSFNSTVANGGSTGYTGNGVGGAGANYSANAGSGGNGTQYRYSAYDTTQLVGGGGGGGGYSTDGWGAVSRSAGRGGSPNGGAGGGASYYAGGKGENAKGYAGGGGGGGYATYTKDDTEMQGPAAGGNGGAGNVAFSMELKVS